MSECAIGGDGRDHDGPCQDADGKLFCGRRLVPCVDLQGGWTDLLTARNARVQELETALGALREAAKDVLAEALDMMADTSDGAWWHLRTALDKPHPPPRDRVRAENRALRSQVEKLKLVNEVLRRERDAAREALAAKGGE